MCRVKKIDDFSSAQRFWRKPAELHGVIRDFRPASSASGADFINSYILDEEFLAILVSIFIFCKFHLYFFVETYWQVWTKCFD
jgi:hypothetical protein